MKPTRDNQKEESTRDVILRTIKQRHQATVNELAEAADVSPVTVRHHLNSLQADSLLQLESVRRKVGRPYHVYSLSEKGEELFPKRYARLSMRLIEEVKRQFSSDVVSQLFQNVVDDIVQEHYDEFSALSFADRLDYLVDMLAEEGFLARWEERDGTYHLVEYSCPYLSLGLEHAEICGFDKELIIAVLESDVSQHSCMLAGDNCCEFSIRPAAVEQAPSGATDAATKRQATAPA